jgi:CRISPR-associated protein Cas5
MKDIDISFLFHESELNKEFLLKIHPLTSLSMVDNAGSYYMTTKKPSEVKLYGMIENLIEFHFDDNVRKKIIKEQNKKLKNRSITQNSNYHPITDKHIKFIDENEEFDYKIFNDVWNQCRKETDLRHYNGCKYCSWDLEEKVKEIKKKITKELDGEKNEVIKKEIEKQVGKIVKENINKLPYYYIKATKRGYILLKDGFYKYRVKTNDKIYNLIREKIETNNLCYLGNSESLVDLEIGG